jgi:peptidyl-prolyl cis-trans isomerase D
MLSYMRENAGSWIIKVLFGIIVVVFVFFYGFSSLRKPDKDTAIAKVGNRKITMSQYQTAYKNTIEMYRSLYKNQFNEEMMEKLGLKQKVLEDLINREILLQEAESRTISVTEDEIKKAIVAMPVFQQDGVFSEALYQRALNYYGLSAADFEKDKERELMLKSLENIVTRSAKVSDQELRDMFQMQQEKVKIGYLCFEPDKIKETFAIPETEIKTYYDQHKETFREPEKVKVKYIAFDPVNFEKKVEVTAREIAEYYESDTEQFFEPKKVRARQILLKSENKEKDAEVFKKAEAIGAQATTGEDFEKLAKKVSEDRATAEKGGDLGYFKKGEMVKPLEDAAFAMKPGEISKPVKSQLGWHIIKVEEVKEGRAKPLEEVKETLEAELRKEKAQQLVEKEAKRAFNRLFKSKNLEDFAQETGMKVQETGFFVFGSSPEDATGKENFSKEAFALAKGELSSAFAVGQKYYIIRLEDKREAQIAPLDEVKAAITGEIEKEKKLAAAKVKAEKLLMDLVQGKQQWEEAAKKEGLEIKNAEVQAIGEYIQGLGPSKEIRDAAFGLDQTKPYGPSPYHADKGIVIIKLQERIAPTDADFAKEKDRMAQTLLQTKQRDLFEQFLQSLKAKANTWVDKKFSATL